MSKIAGKGLCASLAEMRLRLKSQYVTLSHCWGDAKFLPLTPSSCQALETGMLLKALPQTFQDAITITRQLEIQYMWIDSLCIFQDEMGSASWMQEASSMDQVYSNGYCNIAATGAVDSSKGLFFPRNPDMLQLPSLELPADIFIPTRDMAIYALFNRSDLAAEFDRAPLLRRAWVVQERLLSPRVLHFGPRQLMWECCKMFATETLPRGVPTGVMWKNATFKQLDRYLVPNDPWAFHRFWNNVIETYSACFLTKATDKLVALAGMANGFSLLAEGDYVVGMWRDHLVPSLLWRVAYESFRPARRVSLYRAPSFSWTSVEEKVFTFDAFDAEAALPLIEIFDVRLEHANYKEFEEFGPVTAGTLRLRGCIRTLRLRFPDPRRMPEAAAVAGQAVPNGPRKILLFIDLWDDVGHLEEASRSGLLFYVPAWHWGDCRIEMLLLECVNPDRGLFRRIGVANVNHKDSVIMCLQHDEDEARLPCETFDAEKREHVVIIE